MARMLPASVAAMSLASCMLACAARLSQTQVKATIGKTHHGQEQSQEHRAAILSETKAKLGKQYQKHDFKRRLRLCNAYPFELPMGVVTERGTNLTGKDPMPYKTCRDFLQPLWPGDQLEFSLGNAKAGYFRLGDLPKSDAILLLVIYRHDTLTTAASFKSHVFADLDEPQVAVIDAYQGDHRVNVHILSPSNSSGPAAVAFGGVVALNPGSYQVDFDSFDRPRVNGTAEASGSLVATARESYVVLRTGVKAESGPSFPQELVVYPAPLWSSAPCTRAAPAALLLALLAAALPLVTTMGSARA